MVVLVQNKFSQAPTAADCTAFRSQHGHQDVITLYDNANQMNALWHTNFTALSVFVDQERVIKHKFNTDNQGAIEAEITKVLP